MAVNGNGKDRKTEKPLPDATGWTVRTPAGGPIPMPKGGKPAVGLSAQDAFALVRSHRARTGEYVVAVRS